MTSPTTKELLMRVIAVESPKSETGGATIHTRYF
jgi:hypothetical protein